MSVDESRADYRDVDGRKPPIMGRNQPLQGYVEDLEAWWSCMDIPPERAGALVLTRGLSRVPRIQDIGKRMPVEELQKADGLKRLLRFLQTELGVSNTASKISRFQDLVGKRRGGQTVEEWIEDFENRARRVRSDRLVDLGDEVLALTLICTLNLSPQELSNLMTCVDLENGICMQKVQDALRRVVIPNSLCSPQGREVVLLGADERGPKPDDGDYDDEDEYWVALSWNQCKRCLQYGHWSRECPTLTKGGKKGKGKKGGPGTTGIQGKGKAEKGSLFGWPRPLTWTCTRSHPSWGMNRTHFWLRSIELTAVRIR